MITKVFIENFKGTKVFAVWEVDEQGKKLAPAPVISFGAKKASILMKHKAELEQFTGANSEEETLKKA